MRELIEAAPGVYVATADLYTTTSTVIADGRGGCLVVDPAVTVSEVDELAAAIEALGLHPVAGWSSHPHWDHLLWSARLGEVPRFATASAVAAAERERAALIESVCAEAPGHDLDVFARVTPLSGDGLGWRGQHVQVLVHEGHKTGHGALLLPEAGVLIAGDMLSDIEIPLLDLDGPDPVGQYLAGLELLAGASGVRVIVPGHGHIGDRAAYLRRVRADLYYVNALKHGDLASGRDQRIGESWQRAEHNLQFAHLHA
jgi:hydroxyacylglutathione hydrolase